MDQQPTQTDGCSAPIRLKDGRGNRKVPLSIILAAVALGALVWAPRFAVPGGGAVAPALLTFMALAVVWRHRANIARLASGTENRFSFKRKETRKEAQDGNT